ncbi:hypothetical protein F5B18DRAFT_606656 [Nemania serpens]|nr:hypothetical protein F5B18DRAFT_606656 [Nemania serpens]
MTFRHVNCRGPKRSAGDPQSRDVCDLSIPAWPSSVPYDILNELESMPYDIDGWSFDPDTTSPDTEGPSCRTCPFSIYYLLALYSRQYYVDSDTHHNHSKRGHGLRIVNARIVWANPRPALRASSKDSGAAHSIAISKEHLALVQARKHIDHIHVEFETKRGQGVGSSQLKSRVARWVRQRKSDIKARFMGLANRPMSKL